MKKIDPEERMEGWLKDGLDFKFKARSVRIFFPEDFKGTKNYIRFLINQNISQYRILYESIMKERRFNPEEVADSIKDTFKEQSLDRDARGLFAKGNKLGRVNYNPALRVMSKIPEEDLIEIRDVFVNKAKEGDGEAAKFLFFFANKCSGKSPVLSNLKTSTAKELNESMHAVIQEFHDTDIGIDVADATIKMLNTKREFMITSELEQRLNKLEGK